MEETVPSNDNFYQEKTKEESSEEHEKIEEEKGKEKDLAYQRYGT